VLNHRTPKLLTVVRVRELKNGVAEGCIALTERSAETKADSCDCFIKLKHFNASVLGGKKEPIL
jgi:hypothetical protein